MQYNKGGSGKRRPTFSQREARLDTIVNRKNERAFCLGYCCPSKKEENKKNIRTGEY